MRIEKSENASESGMHRKTVVEVLNRKIEMYSMKENMVLREAEKNGVGSCA